MAEAVLRTLRDDLEAGDVVGAIGRFDDTRDAIEKTASRERALLRLARSVTATTEQSSQANTAARALVEATVQSDAKRTEFPVTYLAFAEGGVSAEEFAEEVEETIAAIEAVESRADQLADLKGSVPIPKLLATFAPDRVEVPKGSSIDVDLGLENVGVRAVESIETGVQPIESGVTGFDFGISPGTIDELAADETATLTVTGRANETRTVSLEVTAASTDVTEVAKTMIAVIDKQGFLERARQMLVELEDDTEDRTGSNGNGRGNGGAVPGMLNKLDTARRRIDNLIHELSKGDDDGGNGGNGNGGNSGNAGNGNGNADNGGNSGNSTDNRIESVINLLEAFENQVEGLTGSRLTEKEGGLLLVHSGDVIQALEHAVEADR